MSDKQTHSQHLYEHALNEVLMLGYTIKDGDLYPPETGLPVPPQPATERARCGACGYQYGHAIGCQFNPFDVALKSVNRPAIPAGWEIRHGKAPGEIVIASPRQGPGIVTMTANNRWLGDRMLYALASALLGPKP